jgi:glycerol-3-phosphate dehydrogenase
LVLQPNNRQRGGGHATVLRHPIQPVPTPHTKGIFVFPTLYGQLVVGPTADDQASRTDRTVCAATRARLWAHVRSVFAPTARLEEATILGDYVGIRPATDQRDYQIHVDVRRRFLTCGGIRSTGLTASLGIGRHVLDLLRSTGLLLSTTTTTTSGSSTTASCREPIQRPLPPVADLARQFRASDDGSISIDGYRYRVTHPLTRWGWWSMANDDSDSDDHDEDDVDDNLGATNR